MRINRMASAILAAAMTTVSSGQCDPGEQFLPSTSPTYPAGQGPWSVEIEDLDSDGVPELAVANRLGDSVSALIGVGDGAFHGQRAYPAGVRPVSVVIGDLDGDAIAALRNELAVRDPSDPRDLMVIHAVESELGRILVKSPDPGDVREGLAALERWLRRAESDPSRFSRGIGLCDVEYARVLEQTGQPFRALDVLRRGLEVTRRRGARGQLGLPTPALRGLMGVSLAASIGDAASLAWFMDRVEDLDLLASWEVPALAQLMLAASMLADADRVDDAIALMRRIEARFPSNTFWTAQARIWRVILEDRALKLTPEVERSLKQAFVSLADLSVPERLMAMTGPSLESASSVAWGAVADAVETLVADVLASDGVLTTVDIRNIGFVSFAGERYAPESVRVRLDVSASRLVAGYQAGTGSMLRLALDAPVLAEQLDLGVVASLLDRLLASGPQALDAWIEGATADGDLRAIARLADTVVALDRPPLAERVTIPNACMVGLAYQLLERYDEAESVYLDTLDRAIWEADSVSASLLRFDVAAVRRLAGRTDSAILMLETLLREDLELRTRAPVDFMAVATDLLSLLGEQGRWEEAASLADALDLVPLAFPADASAVWPITATQIGMAFLKTGRADDSAAIFARLLPAVDAAFGPTDVSTINAAFNLAMSRLAQGRLEAASTLLDQARRRRELHVWTRLNELQFESGLLRVQAAREPGPAVAESLRDLAHRIAAIEGHSRWHVAELRSLADAVDGAPAHR